MNKRLLALVCTWERQMNTGALDDEVQRIPSQGIPAKQLSPSCKASVLACSAMSTFASAQHGRDRRHIPGLPGVASRPALPDQCQSGAVTGVKPLSTLLVTLQQKMQGDGSPPAGVWMSPFAVNLRRSYSLPPENDIPCFAA